MKQHVRLANGSEIEVRRTGDPATPAIMLPVAKKSVTGKQAEELMQWGVNPQLGEHLIEGLADRFYVLSFDYEGHLMDHPNPNGLTADQLAADLLQIADAVGMERFSYYGYSWLALTGLQLAIRTERLDALVMGGFPPYEGPYAEMLTVTEYAYRQALGSVTTDMTPSEYASEPDAYDWDQVSVTLASDVSKQFMTLYQSLVSFDDRFIQTQLTMPRLAFAGDQDTIVYGANFGGVTVDMAGLLDKHKTFLRDRGWTVELLSGMDHTQAMQPAAVLPVIKPWLIQQLKGDEKRRG
ncbi:alpha/beta fold hydrolase [Paenibacillus daejeonensis]|uniref:alpha/beta fold hydrolase n=1 Tax=Paenibacillus daejeonensis TaxID=135193 RepID=UPI00036CD716|nr:alpha/beta hydrolase [Paenibacillus daejeonensis]